MTNIRDIPKADTYGICECCRNDLRLTRHHIVPYAFSKHFPNKTFPNNKMMLCRDCHDIVEIYLHKFRRFFSGKLGVTHEDLRQSTTHVKYKKAKAYAWQLISNDTNIPVDKIMEMTIFIHDIYPDAETRTDYLKIAKDTTMIRKTRKNSYGEVVSRKIKELELEDWFWDKWYRKNQQIIKKIRAKGPAKEKIRRTKIKNQAPESGIDIVALMLVATNKVRTIEDARRYYDKSSNDEKSYFRRVAFNWINRKSQDEQAKTKSKITKHQIVKHIAESSSISYSDAEEMYKRFSKSRKRKWRARTNVAIMKKTIEANKTTEE